MRSVLLLCLVMVTGAFSRDHDLSVSVKGTFTTSTRFTYNIDRVNMISEQRTIESTFGYGADIRWNILWDRFSLGISAERINGVEVRPVRYPQFDYLAVPYEEGFDVTAVELSGYYTVPLSTDHLRFYLGGGLGTYDGTRIFSIAGVRAAETAVSATYMGIHVMTGIEYRIVPFAAARFEIKFRDPHFDVTSKFEQPSVNYQGRRIPLPQTEEVTKVNLFGVNYMAGIAFGL